MRITTTSTISTRIICVFLVASLLLVLMDGWPGVVLKQEYKLVLIIAILWLLHGIYRCSMYIREARRSTNTPLSKVTRASYWIPDDYTPGFYLKHIAFNPADMSIVTSFGILLIIVSAIYAFTMGGSFFIPVVILILFFLFKFFSIFAKYKQFTNMCLVNIHTVIDEQGIHWVVTNYPDGINWMKDGNFFNAQNIAWCHIDNINFKKRHFYVCGKKEKIIVIPDDVEKARQIIAHYYKGDRPTCLRILNILKKLDLNRYQINFSIVREADTPIETGKSKFGGCPDLPAPQQWPATEDGTPLTFLMQINCKDIAAFDTKDLLPTNGILSLFCGFPSADEKTENHAPTFRVIYSQQKSSDTLTPSPFPEHLPEERRLPEFGLNFTFQDHSLPSLNDLTVLTTVKQRNLIGNLNEYELIREQVKFDKYLGHTLGYADTLQESIIRGLPSPSNAILLFQIESCQLAHNINLDFGNMGTLYVYINKEDLGKPDFNKIRCHIQSC